MTSTTQKAYIGMGMEGSIARWYEKTTRRDMDEFRKLATRLNALLPNGGDILEVAPGPGFLSVELARNPQLHVSSLVLDELRASAAGVHREIHAIAATYHWDESAILAMPQLRRQAYTDAIRQAGAR